MYSAVLVIHSWLRWTALLFGATATFNAFRDRADTDQRPRGLRWDWMFMLALDLEVLCGLLLYLGLSPYTSEAMRNIGLALRNPGLRFARDRGRWAFSCHSTSARRLRLCRGTHVRDSLC